MLPMRCSRPYLQARIERPTGKERGVETAVRTRSAADRSRVTTSRPSAAGDGEITAAERDGLVRRLYAEDAPVLLHMLSELCAGDRHRAEDIIQETMLRAWRNAPALIASGRESLRPWLYTVARRLAIDAHRHRGARGTEVTGVWVDGLPASDDRIGTMLSRE